MSDNKNNPDPMIKTETIDSRQADRLKPAAQCHVMDVISGAKLGEVLNISSEGLMLVSALPILEGSIYQVNIVCELNQLDAISAGIECLWTDDHGVSGTLAGFQIIDISEADQDALYRLLEVSSD